MSAYHDANGHSTTSSATHTQSSDSRPLPWWLCALTGLPAVMWLFWTQLGWSFGIAMPISANLAEVPVSLCAAGVGLHYYYSWARCDRQRLAWILFALAHLALASAEAMRYYYETTLGGAPFTTVADAAHALYYPLILLSMQSGLFPLTGRRTLTDLLDGVLLVGSAALILWQHVIAPNLALTSAVPLAQLLPTAYLLMDLVVLYTAFRVLFQENVKHQHRALLLAAGLMIASVGELYWSAFALEGLYVRGLFPGSLITMGQLLVLVATSFGPIPKVAAPGAGKRTQDSPLSVLSYLISLAAMGTVFWEVQAKDAGLTPILFGTVLLFSCLVVRLAVEANKNLHLTEQSLNLVAQLEQSEARMHSVLLGAADAIIILDEAGQVRFKGGAALRLLGDLKAEEDALFRNLIHPDDRLRYDEALEAIRQMPDRSARLEIRVRQQTGEWAFVEASLSNLLTDPGVEGIVLNLRDVTRRYELEEELRHMAYTDPLTGLANRTRLRMCLDEALTSGSAALLMLDLDNFKSINDSIGHLAGDELLRSVAGRLQALITQPDATVARIGGDEFLILLPNADEEKAVEVAQEILKAIRQPFRLCTGEVFVQASIGIACSSPESHDPDALLRDADAAMHAAKSNGKGHFQVFEPTMRLTAIQRVELEASLRRAVMNREFVAYFQPEVNLATGEISGFEALARWKHPTKGLIPPAQFIPLAEEVGLIAEIDRLILEQSVAFCKLLQERFPDQRLVVSANISSRQLLGLSLIKEVDELLAQHGIDPKRLVIEITESAMIRDTDQALPLLGALSERGLRLAIDDFGTGYSSLSYLQRLPVSILKIDRSFIDGLSSQRQKALVTGIVNLAQALNLETVAEGIELPEHEEALGAMGCTYGQGYYYAKPLPLEDALALITQQEQARRTHT